MLCLPVSGPRLFLELLRVWWVRLLELMRDTCLSSQLQQQKISPLSYKVETYLGVKEERERERESVSVCVFSFTSVRLGQPAFTYESLIDPNNIITVYHLQKFSLICANYP